MRRPDVSRRRSAGRCSRWSWPRRRCAGGASPRSGRRWNTRVIVVPGPAAGAVAVPTGWLRHPNYVAVVVEGVALPLVHACLDHRARLHRAERRPAHRADPGRERRARRRCPQPSRPMRDLLVAGGGPVGLATALYAVRAGLDVTRPSSRAPASIDKACGEGLMPGAVAALRDLGVRPATATRSSGIRYLDGRAGRPRRTSGTGRARRAPHGPARRAARARPRAGRRGVDGSGRCREVVDRGDHLLVDGEPARYLVAADGLHSPVRRLLGLDRSPPAAAPLRPALRTSRSSPGRRSSRCTGRRAGEAYVTPVGDRPGRRRRAEPPSAARYDDLLAEFPAAGRAARRRGPRVEVRGAGPLRQRVARGGSPAGCCWSATPPATSTRSPARGSRSGWPRPAPPWPPSPTRQP